MDVDPLGKENYSDHRRDGDQAWLESFYIIINRKAQVLPGPGKGFRVGSKETNSAEQFRPNPEES